MQLFGGKSEGKRSLWRNEGIQDNIKMDANKTACEMWIGFIWLRTETDDGLFQTQ